MTIVSAVLRREPRERIDPVELACIEAMLGAAFDAHRTLVATVDRFHDAMVAHAKRLDEKLRREACR